MELSVWIGIVEVSNGGSVGFVFYFYFQKLQFQHVNIIYMHPGTVCSLVCNIHTSDCNFLFAPTSPCTITAPSAMLFFFSKAKLSLKRKENKLYNWVLLLEILFHFHILAKEAKWLVEGYKLMQKARCANGFLMSCLPISFVS